MPQPALPEKEQSLVRFRSVLRFVALANVYKTAVMARTDAAMRAPADPDVPGKYKN